MRTLVVAPHPDDETLGCGGTLFRRKIEGAKTGWLIVTGMSAENGWSADQIATRQTEIDRVSSTLGFADVFQLGLAPARLGDMPLGDIIARIASVVRRFEPTEVFLPHPGDAHSDHLIVFRATAACTKWFRYPSVRRVLTYETPSETDFGIDPTSAFAPNTFIDIGDFIEAKIELMGLYASEVGAFPFPRSAEAIRSLAMVRGAASGFHAAEAFQLLRDRS
jgi:LmbE family N-acetylglucosaminyl deacetylase